MTTHGSRLLMAVCCFGLGSAEVEAQTAARVSAGIHHTCVVTSVGGVKCWGANDHGELGDGTTLSRSTPGDVIDLTSGVTEVTAGNYHTCALTSAGGVKCWGGNGVGQLGDGTTVSRLTPGDVVGLTSGARSVRTSADHTCAIVTGGGVKCWGRNDYGQLGLGPDAPLWVTRPASVLGLSSGILDVATGWFHSCAVKVAGGVTCWGRGTAGQLGDGLYSDRDLAEFEVEGINAPSSLVAAGAFHSCVRTGFGGPGGMKCWGQNVYGQLGDGTTIGRGTAVAVSGLGGQAELLTTGGYHTCARTGGGMKCWGNNEVGQIGDGTTTDRVAAAAALGLESGVARISAGFAHTCVTAITGAVWCWGLNDSGQLGDGTTTTRVRPAPVVGFGGAASSDLTGDGKSDVVWRHGTRGEVWLWPMNGASRVTETPVATVVDTNFEIRGLGDQNGDGKSDLLWRHKMAGLVYYWPMNGGTRLAESYAGTVDPAYDIVGAGDYNGDGKSDMLWRHLANGELWIWLMNGATVLSSTYVMTVGPGYAVVGSGDLNGDDKADIVWRGAGGDVWVWLMNGATPTSMRHVTTVGDLGYQIVGVADHTGDGKADILWWHATRGEVWLWPMNATTLVSQSYVGMVPDTRYRVLGNGDYNGDGKADILWRHATRGEVWVWLMNGAVPLSQHYVDSVPDTGYQIVK